MTVELRQITQLIENLAPESLAADWDNVGLQIGGGGRQVNRVLTTLDFNREVLEEAVTLKAELVVSHHPFIFNNISKIDFDSPEGSLIEKAVRSNVNLYVAHTNYDKAEGGLNDMLAGKIGLSDTKILRATGSVPLKKLVVFVPSESAGKVRNALGDAGAGWIGNYSHCTFSVKGTGTFKPLEGSSPYSGKQGELSRADEIRLETVIGENQLQAVINRMIEAHPYEEVAYDIYPLDNTGAVYGLGRIGILESAVSLKDYTDTVIPGLGLNGAKTAGDPGSLIKKVAVCSGSGGSLIGTAAAAGADLLITGDIKYHDAQLALKKGLCLIDAGHGGTERIAKEGIAEYLRKQISDRKWKVKVFESRINTDPFREI